MSDPTPARRVPLNRDRILATALRMIDADGLDALTMRRLGEQLGVGAMAVYKHLPNKAAVLDGVIGLLLAELDRSAPAGEDWRETLRALAREHRELERRHPGAYGLLVNMPAPAYVAARPMVEGLLASMTAAGFSTEQATRTLRVVVRYAIGFTITRPVRAAEPHVGDDALGGILDGLADPAEEDRLFELGLAGLLRGVPREAGLAKAPASPAEPPAKKRGKGKGKGKGKGQRGGR